MDNSKLLDSIYETLNQPYLQKKEESHQPEKEEVNIISIHTSPSSSSSSLTPKCEGNIGAGGSCGGDCGKLIAIILLVFVLPLWAAHLIWTDPYIQFYISGLEQKIQKLKMKNPKIKLNVYDDWKTLFLHRVALPFFCKIFIFFILATWAFLTLFDLEILSAIILSLFYMVLFYIFFIEIKE